MCHMTHLYVWNDTFICVLWHIHACDVTYLYNLCRCMPWHIHRCMPWCHKHNVYAWCASRMYMTWLILCLSYLIHTSAMTHPYLLLGAPIFLEQTRVCVCMGFSFSLSIALSVSFSPSLPPCLPLSLCLPFFLSLILSLSFALSSLLSLSYTYSLALSHFLFLLFSLSRYVSLSPSVHSIHPHIQTYTRAQAKTNEQTRAYFIIFSL